MEKNKRTGYHPRTVADLAFNKRASFDYEFLDTLEGGLKLTGAEVKAVKLGQAQFTGSFRQVRNGEVWLKNFHISPYKPAGVQETYVPTRDRKVLLHRREIARLTGKTQTDGLTLVPISVYLRGDLVKLKFALARGKKQYQKKESIKERDFQRSFRRGDEE
jgi:SsrA-binding protein